MRMKDAFKLSLNWVRLFERAWDRAPIVGFGNHPETGQRLHETRLVRVTRFWQDGVLVDQMADIEEPTA